MTITMKEWSVRPTDVANLFNPPFLSMILRRAVDGHIKEADQGLPFEMAFVVVPLVLHENTREALPTIATTMQTWIQENREVVIGFPRRASELVPFAREAIMFGVQRDVLRIDVDGRLSVGARKLAGATSYQQLSDEIKKIYSKSEFLGRWLTQQSSATTVFAMLGIKP